MSQQDTGSDVSRTAAGVTIPSSVRNAVNAMFARAALAALGIVIALASKNQLKRDILKRNKQADSARLDSLVNSALTAAIVVAVVFTVLYVLLALQVRKGKNWARVVAIVLACLGVLGTIASLFQAAPAISHAVNIIDGLLDVAIIVLLVRSSSEDFYRRAG